MGRCGTCRSHTQHFCFVHQAFVCDSCLVTEESVHGRCVVRTYREFIEDSSYIWPPVCAACDTQLDVDGDNVRRTCLHVEHAVCIKNSKRPDHKCSACQVALLNNQRSSPLTQAIRKRLRNMTTITRTSTPTITTASSWDDSDKYRQSQSHNAMNLKLEQRPKQPNVIDQTHSEKSSPQVVSETDFSDGIGPRGSCAAKTDSEGTPSRVSMANRSLPNLSRKSCAELRLDLEPLPQGKDTNTAAAVKSAKRDLHPGAQKASTSMRKAVKLGNRRLIELKKAVSTNQRQLLTLAACVVCIIVVSFLMSGEEEHISASSKTAVEHVSLPHVRVNPAFLQPRAADNALQRAQRL